MNIVDIDEAAMTISLKHPQGAVILFDFAAAFPSVSLDFLFPQLGYMGDASRLHSVGAGSIPGPELRCATTRFPVPWL